MVLPPMGYQSAKCLPGSLPGTVSGDGGHVGSLSRDQMKVAYDIQPITTSAFSHDMGVLEIGSQVTMGWWKLPP